MAGRKKNAVRRGRGKMCNICGLNCGRGGPLKRHVEGGHGVGYDQYRKCFYPKNTRILTDSWDDQVKTKGGNTVLIHVLVRRTVGDPGPRGATRSARVHK
jgi:hypothetical protein